MKGSSKQGSNEAYQGKHVVQSQASASNGYTPIQQGEVVVDGTVLQKQRDKNHSLLRLLLLSLLCLWCMGPVFCISRAISSRIPI